MPDAFAQPVFAATMDEAAVAWDLPQPDHIKLDVDGIEAWIIRGGPATLAGAKTLLIEIYGSDAAGLEAEVTPLIAAAGLVEDVGFRGQGSKRNRLYRRP